ncbi:DNA polymerase [Bdellovibrionota bacterium FG-1]
MLEVSSFTEIWAADFEFVSRPGANPEPICFVAKELRSGKCIRLFGEDLTQLTKPPFNFGPESLHLAYFSSAEMNCYLALGWPFPTYNLDLYVEFRNLTNGLLTPFGWSLLGALTHFGIDGIEAVEKEAMRLLAMRGGPYTPVERRQLLEYCESDVVAIEKLFPRMSPLIDVPRGLLRGHYMKAVARIETCGIPMDTETLSTVKSEWEGIQEQLIKEIDGTYDVYDGRTFKQDRFARYLEAKLINWPRTERGNLQLDDDTFKAMSQAHPILNPLRELRVSLSKMRLSELPVGLDGRNRTLISPFKARTGRNQPSNSRFAFGPAVWLRGLIKPPVGIGMGYIDWCQQEFGIAAALSGDQKMQEAYTTGDPYLAFAKQAGAAPPDATKKSHEAIRDQFKACVLAVQYGMGEHSLAARIGRSTAHARELLNLHRNTYRTFWDWSDKLLDHAILSGSLTTVFGWKIHVGPDANPRSLRNFPMQANGAEMLRLACCFAMDRGIQVGAPVHDAVLIVDALETLPSAILRTQEAMRQASAAILNGFELRTDVKRIDHPERYMDKRGEQMWTTVIRILQRKRGEIK